MSSSSSNSDSDSGSGSGSDSDSDTIFQKNIVFTKSIKKAKSVVRNNESEIAANVIKKNLKILEKSRTSQNSLILDERALVRNIDDTDLNTDKEYELWKKRELTRLHRDRNQRIERESN
jgi:hypothetical protein